MKRIIIYPRIPNCRFQKESSFDPPSRPTPLRHRRSIRLWPSAACRNRIALYCYKSILIYSACGSETSQWLVTDWSFHPMSETQTGPKFCNFRLCVCVCVSFCDVFAFLAFCFPFKYWDVCCFYLLARIPVFLDVNWKFFSFSAISMTVRHLCFHFRILRIVLESPFLSAFEATMTFNKQNKRRTIKGKS